MIRSYLLTSAAVMALLLPQGVRAETSVVRVATVPDGAEVTGLSTNGIGDVFLNAQHPGGKNAFGDGVQPATIGYIAGFDVTAGAMSLPPEDQRGAVATNSGTYVTLARAGDAIAGGQVFGGVYDTSGNLMYVSNAPDFNGFVPTGANSAWLYTGWEGAGRDGASAISKLALSRVNGRWQADLTSGRMLDLSPLEGASVLCSGRVTPWGTPLLAEEYFFYNTATWNHPDNYDADEKPGFLGGNDINYIKPKNMMQYLGRMANPYRYGYMIEIENAASADGERLVRQYATGRLSHETVGIMPDARTLYMTDDDSAGYNDKKYNTASGGVLFKFVADQAGDLSSGTLYAAKLTQDATDDPKKAGFDVTWIELGHASNDQIAGWISEYDGIAVADYVDGQTSYISDDQIRAHAAGNAPDARAAFLESRRTAAAMGATNEWDKLEGLTTHGNTVYVATTSLSHTMAKGWGHVDWSTGVKDAADDGDIALAAEDCGATYVAETGADYSITRLEPLVVGQTDAEGRCEAGLPANPDNILALNDGTLLIGEDAGKKKHDLDTIWRVVP